MLTEPQQKLILLAVDNELSTAQEVAFRQLLADSTEALRLYSVLQQQSRTLQNMVQRKAPKTLAPTIMAEIQARKATNNKPRKSADRFVRAMPYAVAASIFLGIVVVSFWANTTRQSDRQEAVFAPSQTEHTPPSKDTGRTENSIVKTSQGDEPVIVANDPIKPNLVAAETDELPIPRAAFPQQDTVFGGSPLLTQGTLTETELRLPFFAPIQQLKDVQTQAAWRQAIANQPTIRIEMFVKDTSKAVRALQLIFEKQKCNVTTERQTKQHISQGLNLGYTLCADVRSEDELLQIVIALSTQVDVEAVTPSSSLHCFGMNQSDFKELKDLYSSEFGWGKLSVDAAKKAPLSTIDEVSKQLDAGSTYALILTALPLPTRVIQANTPEVAQFARRMTPLLPGRKGVLFVVRPQP